MFTKERRLFILYYYTANKGSFYKFFEFQFIFPPVRCGFCCGILAAQLIFPGSFCQFMYSPCRIVIVICRSYILLGGLKVSRLPSGFKKVAKKTNNFNQRVAMKTNLFNHKVAMKTNSFNPQRGQKNLQKSFKPKGDHENQPF